MFAKNIRAENNIVVMVRPEGELQGGSAVAGAGQRSWELSGEQRTPPPRPPSGLHTALQVTDTAALQWCVVTTLQWSQ